MTVTKEIIIELLKNETEAGIDYSTVKTDVALSDQGMDSLDYLTLFLAMDEELGVKVEDEQIEDLKTIDEIVNFVNKQ